MCDFFFGANPAIITIHAKKRGIFPSIGAKYPCSSDKSVSSVAHFLNIKSITLPL